MLIVRMLGSSYHNFQGSRLACYRLMYANFKGHPIWGEQTHAKPTCYNNETPKVQIMFQTNYNSLQETKVMETVLYYNTYNYLFINLLPLQQLEIRTSHCRNDVAQRKMNTMSADNKNPWTQSVKSKVGVSR